MNRLHPSTPAFLPGGIGLLAAVVLAGSAAAQVGFETPDGWVEVGSFRGTAGSRLGQQVSDFFFEQENYGSLYRDLGDLSLGIGLDFDDDDGEVEWDNSFYHQVIPRHEAIAPGGRVDHGDLSTYTDVQTLVSRGRINWAYVPDLVGNADLGLRVEAGTSLTLARAHPPLRLRDRQLEEVLDDRLRLREFERDNVRATDKGLVRLGTEGVIWFLNWVAGALGRATVDTERGAIFFENYAEPLALFVDLGIPVEADLFRTANPVLSPGDRVRQISFVGVSPLGLRGGEWGMSGGYQRFYRYLRETTIVKEEDDTVLVRVRNAAARGHELTPLKIRPELRVLGIVKIGYTFFEQIWGTASTRVSSLEYRIDLADPRGLEAFERLLGQGGRVSWRPLAQAAIDGEGVALLDEETRSGRRRRSDRRARFFNWIENYNNAATQAELIARDGRSFHETSRARTSRMERTLGSNVRWRKRFLVSFRHGAEVDTEGEVDVPPDLLADATLTLLSGITADHAEPEQIRRAALFLQRVTHWQEPDPRLQALVEAPLDDESRFFADLDLRLGATALRALAAVDEEQLWLELGKIFLGEDRSQTWRTRQQRQLWASSPAMVGGVSETEPVELLVQNLGTRKQVLSSKDRYRAARRAARRFGRLQKLLRQGDCLDCLGDAFASWRDINLLQLLIARLASEQSPNALGYEYELFSDAMLRPIVRRQEAALDGDVPLLGGEDAVEREGTVLAGGGDWMGTEEFLEESEPRLRAGSLVYLSPLADTGEQPCWKLRLFSDLLFDDRLTVRIDLRRSRNVLGADRSLAWQRYPLGAPTAIEVTPFRTARFFYDVPLPGLTGLGEGSGYTLLVRMLNDDGLPVSEEQQVRFSWREGASRRLPDRCRSALPPFVVLPAVP